MLIEEIECLEFDLEAAMTFGRVRTDLELGYRLLSLPLYLAGGLTRRELP